MAAKIITFLLILAANLAFGFVLMFFMAFSLNGFSERDANIAFLILIIGGILVSILSGSAGIFLLKFLINKEWSGILSAIVCIAGFSILGSIINVIVFFVAIFAADLIRTSR